MLLWVLAVGGLVIVWLVKLNKDYCVMSMFSKRVKTTDGTPLEEIAAIQKGRTIFGNTFDNFGMDSAAMFQFGRDMATKMKKSYVQYTLGATFYNIIDAVDAEQVLNNQQLITKGIVYDFLHPFLRTGLLTSTDKKWHSRRKILTPAFHFNILAEFEEIFKEESSKFVEHLPSGKENVISLSDLIPKFTLNSVCETALGVQLDECLDGDKYRSSFKMIEECFVIRVSNPFYMFDPIFNYLVAPKYESHLHVVHDFSSAVVKKRRQLFAEELKNNQNNTLKSEDEMPKNKRYAMLDTLLMAEKDQLIDHVGICEEVDTFMFEGFDTTSMGLIFSLMNLSLYPEMQNICYQEIMDNIDDDLSKLDIARLSKLKYLEYFVKETLRMYPSVPAIMRKAVKETRLPNKLILPAGTQIAIHLFDILRNPKYFPNPDVFDPERFKPENSIGRHPFAYAPFSAGQRNCIGQKFAMMEMKTLIVYILKNYKLLPIVDPHEFVFEMGIIIRSKSDIKIKLVRRI